ncbi:MAG: hypothetical protein ABIR54_03955 [Burkholderiaceae bacterium]
MSFLSRILGRPAEQPSNADSVTYDDVGVTRHHASGRVDDVDWADLREVAVMVRAPGDIHIVLTGQRASTIVNPRTPGVALLAQRLAKLTGYDQAAFTRGLEATERCRVVCWRRGGAGGLEVGATAPMSAPVPASAPAPLDFELVPIDADEAPASVPRPTRAALRLDIAPSLATVTDLAKDAMRDMARVYKTEMDGSIDSLVHIDRAIAEWHAAGAPWESVSKSIYAMGSYGGAVLARRAGGRWVDAVGADAGHGKLDDAFLAVELPDGARWSPIAICIDALLDGPEHSLLRTARALLGAQRAAQGNE